LFPRHRADVQGASVTKTGLHASTQRLTGGGSASVDVKKAFVVKMANGAKFVAYRVGKSRLPIKGIYAAMPNTTMAQQDGAARIMWQKTAEAELAKRVPIEVQKALVKEGLSPNTPDSGD
jgi:hypothetical protein